MAEDDIEQPKTDKPKTPRELVAPKNDGFGSFPLNDPFYAPLLAETKKLTKVLIAKDPQVRAAAEKVKDDPRPHHVAAFVALTEQRLGHVQHDQPGWMGNALFHDRSQFSLGMTKYAREHNADPKNDFKIATTEHVQILNEKYNQWNCYGEAAHTGYIIDALRDEGYMPKGTEWGHVKTYVGHIQHAAAVVYDKDKTVAESPGFIIDNWLVAPGRQSPTFATVKEWEEAATRVSATEHAVIKEQTDAYHEAFKRLEDRETLKTIDDTTFVKVTRKFDKGFLVDWYEKNAPDAMRPMSYDPEMTQDILVARNFLGKEPLLPADAMDENYFKSLRARTAHILTQDKDNPAIKMGVTAESISASRSLAELKPKLERYYEAHGYDLTIFKKQYTETEVAKLFRQADVNGDGRINAPEARAFAHLFKDDPEAFKALVGVVNNAVDIRDSDQLMKAIQGVKVPRPNQRQ